MENISACGGDIKPLFPELLPPTWWCPRDQESACFDERGPNITNACRERLKISRSGRMSVACGIKRQAVLRYTPLGCALYNQKFDVTMGDTPIVDYTDSIAHGGLVLQSPDRTQRICAISDLDESELRDCELAPGIELKTTGFVNVKGWQCVNRAMGSELTPTSNGEKLPPLLLHLLRTGEWPESDEWDDQPTVKQQMQCLFNIYDNALSEADDFGRTLERLKRFAAKHGVQSASEGETSHFEKHKAYWLEKAAIHRKRFVECGGVL